MSLEFADTKTQVKTDDYKVENYNRVKNERDDFEHDTLDLQRRLSVLEGAHSNLQKERDEMSKELSTAKQSLQLLKQDKDYLTRQLAEANNRAAFADEKMQQLTRQVDAAKQAREEMYEKYVASRNLREARDMAISERERVQATEREMNAKYEQLVDQFRELQSKAESRVSEVLTKEYYGLQTAMEKRVVEMEAQLAERNAKLDTYERMERELDDVIMQAADVEDEQEAEKVLFSYGYARRVLQLERANTSLRQEIQREQSKVKQLAEELKSSNEILEQARQPYNYLIESIRVREGQTQQLRKQVEMLEEDLKISEEERSQLVQIKNPMALDLERLLNQLSS
nr:hypothetical protein BaRGS_016798 [Batillaria attramentaria]